MLNLFRSSCRILAFAAVVLTIEGFCEEAPKLPDGVEPLPDTLSVRLKDLLKNAEKYRGLKCIHTVPGGALKEDALRVKMRMAIEEELPAAKMKPLDSSLKAFGLIPEKMDLATYYPDLLTSQVGGYYDPRRQYLVIVQREGGMLGKEVAEKFGKAMSQKMEETVMVHELTHAIQDQHFNLKKFMIDDPLSDAGTARLSLVEGDATVTMYDFMTGMKMEDLPMIEDLVSQMIKDPSEMMAMTPEMPGAKEMANAPAWFRDGMVFTYMQGFVFCIKVKKAGGQALLDYAFTKDPPRSTEQILHPEKWYGDRDDPIEITLPDLSATLPGWAKVGQGTLGELGIKIWLNEMIEDNNKAAAAAEGWGGDRFAVFEKDGARTLCWVTDWDTNQDAAKFVAACSKLGAHWLVKTDDKKRVSITHSPLEAEATNALHQALSRAVATAPDNRLINIAAVKKNAEKPEDVAALNKIAGKDGDVDASKLLNDPNVGKLLKGLGGDDKNGGVDIGALMKDPAIQEMAKQMLSQKNPAGVVSVDGREYKNEALGITLKLPDSAKNWKVDLKTPVPTIMAMVTGPDGVAQIQIVAQAMPMEMPIETMAPFLEMGYQAMLKDYKKYKSGVIGEGDAKGLEMQISGQQMGANVRMLQRIYMRGGKMILFNAISPLDDWKTNEKVLTDIMDGIKLSAPKKADDKTLK